MSEIYYCKDISDAWDYWFDRMLKQVEITPSRGGKIAGELLTAITVLSDPRKNLVASPRRNLDVSYAIGELLWYMSGSNEAKQIIPYSKFWEKLATPEGTIKNSAYGWSIKHKFGFDQWEYTKQLLLFDPSTRQAVIHIKPVTNQDDPKDIACTVALQFLLRCGRLYMTTFMRSNDLWLGFPYDVFCFTCLQIKMAMELNVELGDYTHIAGSLHLYERHVKGYEKNCSKTVE